MQKKILFSFLAILLFVFSSPIALADSSETNTVDHQVEGKKLDSRAKILSAYLANFDSPLKDNAQDFIDAADAYNLDWKMVASIAGVESTFGKQIPGGYNAWGWGVYGTQAIYFSSWRDGIFTVSKGLRENYLNKGLTDPYSINRIYAASPAWGAHVSFFMADLDKFAGNFKPDKSEITQLDNTPIIAAVSGQLVSR